MSDSIFRSCIRSFFSALLGVLGFCVALFIVILALASMNLTTSEPEKETLYTAEIKPNAKGVRKSMSSSTPVILKVNIVGVIGIDALTMDSIRTLLVESREGALKDDRVKAILLNLETPGGTVVDADGIYRALKAYKEQYKVPIFAYVDGLCASGGMYVASAADKIFASEISLVGSVGVIMPSFINIFKLLDKIGVEALTLSEGKGKDAMDPLRPWKKGEEDNYKMLMAYYYEHFVDVVTSNRPKLDKTKLVKEYGAQVYPASEAKEYGYIDESNTSYNQVLEELVKHVGIKDDSYQVIELTKQTWYSELFSNTYSLFKGEIKHRIELPLELDQKFTSQFLYLYSQ